MAAYRMTKEEQQQVEQMRFHMLQQMEHWQNMAKLAMYSTGKRTLDFTQSDMDDFASAWPPETGCVLLTEQTDTKVTLRLVTIAEANEIAKQLTPVSNDAPH